MKKPLINRITAVLTAVFAGVLCLSEVLPAAAETINFGEIHISSAEELSKFSDSCVFDKNSRGKTYILDCDINMSGTDFEPIPSFGGTFDGNGFSVSGIKITRNGENTGFFRKLESTAEVKNLSVKGRIVSDSGINTGGIAGVNNGTITNSAFIGSISAEEKAGGIAGQNNGVIASCRAEGVIAAKHMAGGITGENTGAVISSENLSSVNTSPNDDTLSLDDFSPGSLGVTERTADISDIGGIAGYSEGQIQNSVNKGTVGYAHVGYNIGGIAGRQKGYISDCKNYGIVNGRKDVGGIVGQGEPSVSLLFAEKKLNTLRTELDALNDTLDGTIRRAESRYDISSDDMNNVFRELDNITEAADGFCNEADRVINADIDSVNELSSRASELTARLETISECFSESAECVKISLDKISEATDYLNEAMGDADSGFEELSNIFDDLFDSVEQLRIASDSINDSLLSLQNALGDPETAQNALDDLSASLFEMGKCLNELSLTADNAFEKTEALIDRISEKTEKILENAENYLPALCSALTDLSINAQNLASLINSSADDIAAIRNLISEGNYDPAEYAKYISNILAVFSSGSFSGMFSSFAQIAEAAYCLISQSARDEYDSVVGGYNNVSGTDLGDSLGQTGEKIKDTGEAAEGLFSALSVLTGQPDIPSFDDVIESLRKANLNIDSAADYIQNVINEFDEASVYFSDSFDSLLAASAVINDAFYDICAAGDNLSDGFAEINEAAEYFSSLPDVKFTGADEDIINTRKNLEGKVTDLIDALDAAENSLSVSSDMLTEDLSLINKQVRDIYTTILDMAEDISEASTDIEDYTEDISAEDTYGRSDGKISFCENLGEINGDTCVGGIVGTMGIDLEFDPEGDIQTQGKRSSDFMYKSKTVTRDCINRGTVTSKYDNCGGIAGLIETGCLIDCTAYGVISSTDGGYVGGAAGKSESAVYRSCVMAHVGGKNYVGGLCGYCMDMRDSVSYVIIDECGDYTGLAVGYEDAEGTLVNNCFVDNSALTGERSVGGADGVSLDGKAYPVTYDEMVQKDVPADFRELKLTFASDGETVGEYKFSYGGKITDADVPEIPEKQGFFSEWTEFPRDMLFFPETVNAVYKKYVTSISSEMKRGEYKALVVSEGAFTDSDTISAENIGNNSYVISVPDDKYPSHIIRFCTEKAPEKTSIYINGVLAKTKADGSYAVFEVRGNEFTLREEYNTSSFIIYIIIAAVFFAAVLIVIIAAGKKKKKNNRG